MARTRHAGALIVAFVGLAVGIGLSARYQRLLSQPRQMAITVAQISPALYVELGQPLQFGRFPRAKLHRGGNANMAISVSGPNGAGTLIEWAQQSAGQWRICSLAFRPDNGGRQLDLVSGESTHCDPE
jgi:hypothetical protein